LTFRSFQNDPGSFNPKDFSSSHKVAYLVKAPTDEGLKNVTSIDDTFQNKLRLLRLKAFLRAWAQAIFLIYLEGIPTPGPAGLPSQGLPG